MPEGFKTRWTKTAGGIDGMAAPFGDPIAFLCYQFEYCLAVSFAREASMEIDWQKVAVSLNTDALKLNTRGAACGRSVMSSRGYIEPAECSYDANAHHQRWRRLRCPWRCRKRLNH